MKEDKRWQPPGWPWELELLTLVFVVASIAIPLYLQVSYTPDTSQMSLFEQAELARQQEAGGTWQESSDFLWAIAIVCLYLAHLVMAGASIDLISTPVTHLFTPLIFSGITYYRLLKIHANSSMENAIVNGSIIEISMWLLGVLVITFLVARLRMARHMIYFRDTHWEFSSPTYVDKTYLELMLQIQPLIYFPRMIRASDEGLLVEGWLYVMPIPFKLLQNVDRVSRAVLQTNGLFLATSTQRLVRIHLTESPEPVYVSPTDQKHFLQYCQSRINAMKPQSNQTGDAVMIEED